jgi:hypothetical protein
MSRFLHVVMAIATSMVLQGCVGFGAWTLGSRSESIDRPHLEQSRGSVDLHKKAAEGTLATASTLRAQWGEPDRIVPGREGSSEWVYNINGFRWSGLVVYAVILPLPAMIPIGSQYVSIFVREDRIEKVILTDWAFKAGVYCGFFGLMNGGWGCGAGTFEELQTPTSASGK